MLHMRQQQRQFGTRLDQWLSIQLKFTSTYNSPYDWISITSWRISSLETHPSLAKDTRNHCLISIDDLDIKKNKITKIEKNKINKTTTIRSIVKLHKDLCNTTLWNDEPSMTKSIFIEQTRQMFHLKDTDQGNDKTFNLMCWTIIFCMESKSNCFIIVYLLKSIQNCIISPLWI